MRLKRYFFIGDDLDELAALEHELEQAGLIHEQIHVLTLDDAATARYDHLNEVKSLMKRDTINSGLIGLGIGIVAAVLVLLVTWLAGWHRSAAGWTPFALLALIVLGFFTWEGGFIGIQSVNRNFEQFRKELEAGRHVFFVDLRPEDHETAERVILGHRGVRMAGTGRASPHWLIGWQRRLRTPFTETLPWGDAKPCPE